MTEPVQVLEPVEVVTEAPPPPDSDVILIPRVLVNYIVIAVAFFILGAVVVSMLNARAAAADRELINQAVAVALADRGAATAGNAPNPNARIDVSVDDDPAWGPEDAPVVIVEFSDFQCPFCGRFHEQTYSQLRENYAGQIRFVYRDYPILQLHPNALISAQAANCAGDQDKYWEYHDLLLTNQDRSSRADLGDFAAELELDMDEFNECLDSGRYEQEVNADVQDGNRYGVRGTPTFFINGQVLIGAQPYETFAAAIEAELSSAASLNNLG